MEAKLVTQQKLVVEVNEKKFELFLPTETKLYEGYQALMNMASIFVENMAKEKKDLEERAKEVKPKEDKKKD